MYYQHTATAGGQPQAADLPPARQPDVYQWGADTLRYVLAHNCTGAAETEALERAIQASTLALGAGEMIPAARERIVAARRIIFAALARRRRDHDMAWNQIRLQLAGRPEPGSGQPGSGGGQRVPLPVGPRVQPPQGQMARPTDIPF